jgi:hypothetical protein
MYTYKVAGISSFGQRLIVFFTQTLIYVPRIHEGYKTIYLVTMIV